MSTEEQYETYWSEKGYNPTGKNINIIRILTPLIKPKTRVLDIGCGSGDKYANHFIKAKKGLWVGMDISKNALKSAKHAKKYVVDFNNPPFPNVGNFDLVVCVEVLEHVLYPDKVLAYAREHLSDGGTAVVTIPNSYSWVYRIKYLFGINTAQGAPKRYEPPWRDPHLRYLNKTSFEKLLRTVFKVEDIHIFSLEPVTYRGISIPLDGVYPSLFAANFVGIVQKARK